MISFQKGSLVGWSDEGLHGIAIKLRDLGTRTNMFVYLEPSHDVQRIRPLLESAKLEIRTPAGDGTIAAEVRRPDGAILTGFVGTPIPSDVAAGVEAPEGSEVLARSPRFEALILGVVRGDDERSRRFLEDCLTTRTAPLALIASKAPNGGFGIQPRSWPGKQALVAYGGERSLHRAARELGMQAGSYAIAAMPVSKLFGWAASIGMPVMLCAFGDGGDGATKAWHVPLEVADLRRLAPE